MNIIEATESGRLHLVKSAILRGENVNRVDSKSNNALAIAAKKGYYEIAELLIQNGAEVNLFDRSNSPFIFAIDNGYIQIVKLLIQSNLDLVQATKIACTKNSIPALKELVEYGHDVFAADGTTLQKIRTIKALAASIPLDVFDKTCLTAPDIRVIKCVDKYLGNPSFNTTFREKCAGRFEEIQLKLVNLLGHISSIESLNLDKISSLYELDSRAIIDYKESILPQSIIESITGKKYATILLMLYKSELSKSMFYKALTHKLYEPDGGAESKVAEEDEGPIAKEVRGYREFCEAFESADQVEIDGVKSLCEQILASEKLLYSSGDFLRNAAIIYAKIDKEPSGSDDFRIAGFKKLIDFGHAEYLLNQDPSYRPYIIKAVEEFYIYSSYYAADDTYKKLEPLVNYYCDHFSREYSDEMKYICTAYLLRQGSYSKLASLHTDGAIDINNKSISYMLITRMVLEKHLDGMLMLYGFKPALINSRESILDDPISAAVMVRYQQALSWFEKLIGVPKMKEIITTSGVSGTELIQYAIHGQKTQPIKLKDMREFIGYLTKLELVSQEDILQAVHEEIASYRAVSLDKVEFTDLLSWLNFSNKDKEFIKETIATSEIIPEVYIDSYIEWLDLPDIIDSTPMIGEVMSAGASSDWTIPGFYAH